MVEDEKEAPHLSFINSNVPLLLRILYSIYIYIHIYIYLNTYTHIAFQVVVVCIFPFCPREGFHSIHAIRPQSSVRIQAAKLEETQGNEKMVRGSDGKCDRRWPTRSDSQPFHKELQQTIPLTGP